MPGKCKISLVLAVFLALAVFTARESLAAPDPCTCPPGGCTPGAANMGAFQNQVVQGLGAAGQDMSRAYMYGSFQVGGLNVQTSYGLDKIDNVFNGAINNLNSIMDIALNPEAFVINAIASKILAGLKSQFGPLNGLLDANSCMPVPSFSLGVGVSGYGFTTPNNNCNGVPGASMPYSTQQALSGSIYNLMWGQ